MPTSEHAALCGENSKNCLVPLRTNQQREGTETGSKGVRDSQFLLRGSRARGIHKKYANDGRDQDVVYRRCCERYFLAGWGSFSFRHPFAGVGARAHICFCVFTHITDQHHMRRRRYIDRLRVERRAYRPNIFVRCTQKGRPAD